MRPPRFRFPDQVRTTTRAMAWRMVRNATIAETPEQMDAWIERTPDVREILASHGYGTAFGANDLFPLLKVFVVDAGGPAPPGAPVDAPPPGSGHGWLIGLAVVLVIILAILLWEVLR